MSRTDPGATSGSQTYEPRRVCLCSDGEVVHDLNSRGVRTACSHEDAAGKCGCVKFELGDEWAEALSDQRDAAIAAVARVRALCDRAYQVFEKTSGDPLHRLTLSVAQIRGALDGEVSTDGPRHQG